MNGNKLTCSDEYSRTYFAPDVAPFGELNILTTRDLSGEDTRVSRFSISRITTEVMAGSIAYKATTTADWLPRALPPSAMAMIEDSHPYAKRDDSFEATADASIAGRIAARAAVFAICPPQDVDRSTFSPVDRGLGAEVNMDQVVGWAGKKPYYPGKPFENIWKECFRISRSERPITSVDVDPAYQGRKIGVALFDAILATLDPDRPTLTYVPSAAPALLRTLESFGFEPIGKATRNDLVGNMPIAVTKLQSPSPADTRCRLAARYPWLKQTQVI